MDLTQVQIMTDRLVLSALTMQWKEDIFREFTPEITKYMFPRAPDAIRETEEFIENSLTKMQQGEELVCAILDKATQEFLGCTGIHNIKSDTPEFGVWLKKAAHGKRIGREAVTAMKQWADDHLRYAYLLYPVDKNNIASRKIAESLGGVIYAEYDKETLNGSMLHTVEYRIYPASSH